VKREVPPEEKYALTGQIRRSSRTVCLNLREAWAKRRYEVHFVSKLTDCRGENSETDLSLDFALECGSITPAVHADLARECEEIGKMIGGIHTASIQVPTPPQTPPFFLLSETSDTTPWGCRGRSLQLEASSRMRHRPFWMCRKHRQYRATVV
jgi:four helix bundle protein